MYGLNVQFPNLALRQCAQIADQGNSSFLEHFGNGATWNGQLVNNNRNGISTIDLFRVQGATIVIFIYSLKKKKRKLIIDANEMH